MGVRYQSLEAVAVVRSMLSLRPYWRSHVSIRPLEILYDQESGKIVSTVRNKAELSKSFQGWYAEVGGDVVALYSLDGGSFNIQIGKTRFSLSESLEATIQEKRWKREVSLRQQEKLVTIVDRSRGRLPQMLSVPRLLDALALDDLDLDDLVGDVCNWISHRQTIPRDLFVKRLSEENAFQKVQAPGA